MTEDCVTGRSSSLRTENCVITLIVGLRSISLTSVLTEECIFSNPLCRTEEVSLTSAVLRIVPFTTSVSTEICVINPSFRPEDCLTNIMLLLGIVSVTLILGLGLCH